MHSLTVAANLENLEDINQYVIEVAKTANLGAKDTYRLRLAVDEIATNIITHGYGENGLCGDIELKAQVDDYTLTIIVEDQAIPYDPRLAPEPDVNLPLEQRAIGGLGVYLTIRSVDEFRYEYVEKCNRNVFVIYR
jgi:anti-sigma regulatory factor (Ser/Thr protein kinase)